MATAGGPTVIETLDHVRHGIDALIALDPRFAPLFAATGIPPLRRAEGGYRGLLRIVTGQQLSLASAAAIWTRMEEGLAPLEPAAIDRRSDDELRATGLSAGKVRTIRHVSRATLDGALDFEALHGLTDEAVHDALTAIKGIGPWTADVYLLSCLGRRDAWPAGDLALQVAAQAAFALDIRPDHKRMHALGAPWRPWRAVAARLIWAYYRTLKANPRKES